MSDASDFARARRVTPSEAVAHIQGRSGAAITYSWQDAWQEEHATQFTVSRLARLDILQALHDGLSKSVQGDLSRKDWLRDAKKLLADRGWWGEREVLDPATNEKFKTKFDPARLQLIFDMNTGMAASAGQWERAQAAKKAQPYIRYITKRDERVREAHRRWDGVTLPVDDAFWHRHWPPNGWRCRCRVIGVSEAEYLRGITPTGAPMIKTAPEMLTRSFTNRRTGEITQVPVGIDPGFDFNPGVAKQQTMDGLVKDKLAAADAFLANQARSAGFTSPKPDQSKELAGQDTWQFLGLRDLREVEPRMQAPEILKQGESLDEAIAIMRQALMVPAAGSREIITPVGKVTMMDQLLWHVLEKRTDARERFANLVLPTLQTPDEVWLTRYTDDTTRKRFIKLFSGSKYDILIIVQEQPNGDIFWNMMNRDRRQMNNLRSGELLFSAAEGEKAS